MVPHRLPSSWRKSNDFNTKMSNGQPNWPSSTASNRGWRPNDEFVVESLGEEMFKGKSELIRVFAVGACSRQTAR